ncbi:MAG: hypothetical protein K2K40_07330 [Paramuribaculum sp.]|nr:hypothetical protein [Paramuribaculum sp.]
MNKKMFVPATLVALMGLGAYFGHVTATSADGLSDLELANAEALALIESDGSIGCFLIIIDAENPMLDRPAFVAYSCVPCGTPHVAIRADLGNTCK